ncbi:kinetochore-associated Ndc80 complex subunit spc25, partial [Spiromyces aspiralis]
ISSQASQQQQQQVIDEYEPPTVKFYRTEDKKHITEFVRRVDELVEDIKKLINGRRAEFEAKIQQNLEREKEMAAEVEALTKQHQQLVKAFEDEHSREEVMQVSVEQLEVEQEQINLEVAELEEELSQLECELEERKRGLERMRGVVESQQKEDRPELEFFERVLGLEIRGGDRDNELVFVFTKVSTIYPDKPYLIAVDLSKRTYKVSRCEPAISKLDQLVDWLNETRDFYSFLKKLRAEFVTLSS